MSVADYTVFGEIVTGSKILVMIFTKMHISMKRTKRMEDNFHPIFS